MAARALFRDYGDTNEIGHGGLHTFTFHLTATAARSGVVATDVLLASNSAPTGGSLAIQGARSADVLGPAGANELFVRGPGRSTRQLVRQGPPVTDTVVETPNEVQVEDLIEAALAARETLNSAAYASKGSSSWSASSAVVLILDDVKISHYTIAIPAVEAVGGKLTLAVNSDAIGLSGSQMSSAQILDAYNRGHEIAAHSKTHTDMTGLTAAQRVTEWDTPKTAIEAIIGAGNCKTWVYPGNAHNATTDTEGYLRYDRLIVGPTQGAPYFRPLGDRGGLVHGRLGWADINHAQVLAEVARLAPQGVIIPVYTHAVDNSTPGSGVTQAQFTEFIALCVSLGLPIISAKQGIPSHQPVPDAGFEDSTLASWTLTPAGASTIASVADAPMTGLAGSRSLRVVGDGSGASKAQSLNIPIMFPSEVHTLSVRMHGDSVSAGNFFGQYEEFDAAGASLAAATNFGAIGVGTTAWIQKAVDFTPNALTRTIVVRCATSAAFVGTAWFDHWHIGPKRRGVFG